MFKLGNRIEVYIPTTIRVNEEADTSEYVDSALTLLSQLCGGATAQEAKGAWVSETEGLITEDVTIVYAYASEIPLSLIRQVLKFGAFVKTALDQESVAIGVNSKLLLI